MSLAHAGRPAPPRKPQLTTRFPPDDLHLTPVASEVNLANQFPHLAATKESERGKQAHDAPRPASEKDPAQARAIHMTIKSAGAEGEELVTETMADRMRAIAAESFRRMAFVQVDGEDAWAFYQESLFLPPPEDSQAKGKERDDGDGGGDEALADRVPRLRTTWEEADYLDHIRPAEQRTVAVKKEVNEPAAVAKEAAPGKGTEPKGTSPKKNRPGRPKGSTSVRGRGGKAKSGSSKATPMDVD